MPERRDNLTPEQRRRAMSSVRQQDTDIERRLRSELHRRGYRFRKHLRGLPGRPDIIFTRARVAVFVDGDFWHGYDFDSWKSSLSTYWREKIERNRQRDARNTTELEDMGWTVVRVWQHEVNNDLEGCIARIANVLPANEDQS